ncbi:hypothetical protein SAMN03159496_01919 [Rhizobium sp. NFR07]|uniref:hypothetical protein n=1 Tax=Rhizobium sp. NFR07 TaxID=1566262 RepID=UPI0008E3C9B2|nr:hypothetical protein [Rhizobium sp. NFR07]SFB10972.1 hypothetical protein SAMN03159496_01919 [Rhizobium sp. NFR07]
MKFTCFCRYITFAAISLLSVPALAAAEEKPASIEDFFAGQGCAIGPATYDAAIRAGFEPEAIDRLKEKARADEKTVITGDWLVLSPQACTIRIPKIESAIRLGDPEVVKSTSAKDAYSADGDPGCFLVGSVYEEVITTRGWFPDIANLEYIRFLAEGIASGTLSFYSPDPLRTPPGVMITSGECADVPSMADVRRSHALLVEHFDTFVRAYLNDDCEKGGMAMIEVGDMTKKLGGESRVNAWTFFEVEMIARGAGWWEGMGAKEKGAPRPPMCHYK